MTPSHHDGRDSHERGQTDSVPEGGYEWECPFCSASRINRTPDEDGEANARQALRAHIMASEGDGHGYEGEFPAGAATLTLDEHVSHVEERD